MWWREECGLVPPAAKKEVIPVNTSGDQHEPHGEERCWIVAGRVQGVGYRAFVQRRARALGLTGYAQNLADGTVLVRAHGPAKALADLERALRRGPRLARVERVAPVSPPPGEPPPRRGFAIR